MSEIASDHWTKLLEMSEISSNYWTKLLERLNNYKPEIRPSCRNIIMDRDEWFYKFDQIRELVTVNKICNQTYHNYNFEKDFKEYFIYQKKDSYQTSLKTSNEVISS